MNQLVRCIHCDEFFLKTPFDQWPAYESLSHGSPESFRSIEKDDFQEFLKNHRGHQLENLKIIEDSFVSEKPYSEPVKISYFKATNGKKNFVIKKFREKIDQPLKYQLIGEDYLLKCVNVECQYQEIATQLEAEFKSAPLPQSKVDAFLKLCKQVVERIDINRLERIPYESSNPLEVYYKLNDVSLAYLLRSCRNIFKGQAYLDLEEFIRRHNDNGVLQLKAIYEIQTTEMAKSKKRIIEQQIRSKKRKVAAKRQV